MMDNYILKKSENLPNGWVLADAEHGIVIVFEEGRFNETQKITFLDDIESPDPVEIASRVREMGEWLMENHRELVFGAAPERLDFRELNREVRHDIGGMLKALREEAGYTVRELSAITGVDKGMICRIEGGRSNSGIDVFSTIAHALGWRVCLLPADDYAALDDEDDEFMES